MSYYDNSKELDQIADLQATIADLQGQLKAAKAPRMYDCGSCAIGKGFEQRVAQLEAGCEVCRKRYNKLSKQYGTLQADHARVLGLVQAFIEAWDHDGEPDAMSYEVAVDQAKKYLASLPAQPAQVHEAVKEDVFTKWDGALRKMADGAQPAQGGA